MGGRIFILDKESQIMEDSTESELLKRDSEIADLKRKNASAQIEITTLRAYADRIECHLRDAKAHIVLLMSKIQEFEAREY